MSQRTFPPQQQQQRLPGRPGSSGNRPSSPASRFPGSGLPSRFGATQVELVIQPIQDTLIRFKLEGLGGPLHELLGAEITGEAGSYAELSKVIAENRAAAAHLTAELDRYWSGLELHGAALVYIWEEDIERAVQARRPTLLRALDARLVLNVLARTRAHLLQPRSPLALEPPYLDRVLCSDDPQLIRLVKASGYFEEPPLPHPTPQLDEDDS
jgi:hypothetical protein